MRPLGVNTWVWTSPLTDAALPELLRTIAAMGFDGVELPLENAGDLDPHATASPLKEHGLAAWVVGAMAPGRDLVAASPETVAATQDYLRTCIDLAAAVGRTQRVRTLLRPDRPGVADEPRRARAGVRRVAREPRTGRRLRRGARRARRHRAPEPLRDVFRQHRRPGPHRTRAAARSERQRSRPGPGHLSPQHRGAQQRRRRSRRGRAPGPRPGLRERPGRARR